MAAKRKKKSKHILQVEFLRGVKKSLKIQLEPTPLNQAAVRIHIMKFWSERFVKQRAKFMVEYAKASPEEQKKLRRDKYFRHRYALDLTGACKLVAQVAYVLFDLDKTLNVVSNPRHTFLYSTKTGQIFDLNMYCEDVISMEHPHAYDAKYSKDDKRADGLASWNIAIKKLAESFEKSHEQAIAAKARRDRARAAESSGINPRPAA